MSDATVGIIGGSGLYNMDGLQVIDEMEVPTPFGDPSDKFTIGEIDGVRVAFLARHGRGHRTMPSDINYRANIFGFKALGVHSILSASASSSSRRRAERSFRSATSSGTTRRSRRQRRCCATSATSRRNGSASGSAAHSTSTCSSIS